MISTLESAALFFGSREATTTRRRGDARGSPVLSFHFKGNAKIIEANEEKWKGEGRKCGHNCGVI
jgi:hypothetical protein